MCPYCAREHSLFDECQEEITYWHSMNMITPNEALFSNQEKGDLSWEGNNEISN